MKTVRERELFEHYSHQLRTPLGVALGVLSDLVDGYQVPEPELQDAKQALERMVLLLNEMRELGQRRVEERQRDGSE